MEAFDYEAVNKLGKVTRGTVMANSARAARRDLKARELMPLKMNAASAPRKAKQRTESRGRVKQRILTQASRQLAILIKSGTPIAEALKVTALQFEGSPMRKSLLDVRSHILEGRRMSEAMAEEPKTYSELYRSMVSAGENSGQLGMVLDRLAGDLEAAQKVRRKIIGATIYPIVLSIVALAVIVILMVKVVPKVVTQFESFNQELPTLTKATIAFSEWLQSYGLMTGLGIAAVGFVLWQSMKVRNIRRRVDKFVLGLPYIGKLNRDMNAARFARTMSGLIDSGTPVLQAIGAARNTLKNIVLREAMDGVVEQVRGGSSVGAALKKATVFPPLMVHMVAGGEASGDLGHMFAISAEYLESEFDSSTTIVLNLLEPLIIVFMGGVVLLIVAAIFLPILRLNTLSF
ncbi:MAG: type II secretion system inner membrane protein GspF [Hyphomonadaceae bacterium]|nr:type II secretion system inner membrane protein GspF [Hyphomonadaceae bacterium]